ncbi:hypothetical protein NSQ14_02940 [Caldifermentibacillus hisashii]|uniref:hypothetical protein n=1 Tax=Caldifermentibacillus hisashii TaxID=996558 RepID=UPI0031FD8AF8
MFSFIVVVFLLFLVPGPAVIITISQTIKSGRTNGILTDLAFKLKNRWRYELYVSRNLTYFIPIKI